MAQEQLGFPHYPLQKTEGFRASLKTSALAPVCLPWSREAGWMSDVSEFSMSSPIIHPASRDRSQPPEQIERRSTSGQADFHRLFQPSPNGWIVASVYSLASQWRVA